MESKHYYVYILTNWNHKVMYIGMTRNLSKRLYEHKHKLIAGFSQKYNVTKLVYFEVADDPYSAVSREREIKGWRRERKNRLVAASNPGWRELSV